jgi:hypothetical protein
MLKMIPPAPVLARNRRDEVMSWTWEHGTQRERGEMVRSHVTACRGDHEKLRELFWLTESGLRRILAGDDWRPEYEDGARRAQQEGTK